MMKSYLTAALLAAFAVEAQGDPFVPDRTVDAPEGKGGYAVSPVYTLGGADAPEPEQFYERIGGVVVDGDAAGNLYVLDDGNHRVQIFDPKGRFVRSIGKEGQGPGEFQLPQLLSVNAGGQFAVLDMGLQRISIFDADGSLMRDQIVTGPVRDIALADDGSLAVGYAETPPAIVEWFDPAGASVWKYGAKPAEDGDRRVMRFGVGSVSPRLALAGATLFAASEGVYCVRPLDRSGKEAPAFARTFERTDFEMPAPKEGEEGGPRMIMIKKTVDDGGGDAATGGGGPKVDVEIGDGGGEWKMDMGDMKRFMPEFEPDIRGLLAWPDGRIWVVTSERDDDTMHVDEWSTDGRYRKRFELPGYDTVAVGSDGAFYAVEHDADDFPIVHRLDVTARH